MAGGATVAEQGLPAPFPVSGGNQDDKPQIPLSCLGAKSFEVTAHVTQDWKIDCNGTFLEALNECVEVTHYPDEADIWSCANCDFSAEGKSFLVNTHS